MGNKTRKKQAQGRRKGKPGKPPGERWTQDMRKFCDGLAQGMTQTAAARHARYACPRDSGRRLMKKRIIIRWQAEYEKMRKKAMQNALNEDARAQVISRRQVEEKFADILLNGEVESAQIGAGLALARINGWLGQEVKNIGSRLNGKSPRELWFVAMHGREPADAKELQAFEEARGVLTVGQENPFSRAKQEDIAKVQAMVADPLIWMQQYTKTKDSHWREHGATSAYRPFPDKPYFRPMVQAFQEEPVLFVEKSRDMMISWLFVGLFTHTVMTTEGIEVIFQSQKEDKAAELIDYAKCLYEHQSPELQAAFPLTTKLSRQARLELKFAHGGRLLGIPGGADQIRSYHPWGLFADEAAFQPEAGECYDHAVPVCKKIVEVSTIGPPGCWFNDVVTDNI